MVRKYLKTQLPDVLTVRSIVTVYHKSLKCRTLEKGISVGESHYFPELLYVDQGSHTVLVDNILYRLDEGQIILYAPFAFHGPAFPSEATVDIVSFESDSEMLAGLYNRVITLTTYQRTLLSRIITPGVAMFERGRRVGDLTGMALREGTADYELQLLKNQLELLLLDLLHTQTPPPERPAATNHANYREERFGAVTAYVQAYLAQPLTMAYVTALRLGEAKRMIRETTLNFTQIADAL